MTKRRKVYDTMYIKSIFGGDFKMFNIVEAEEKEVTKLVCPRCKEKLPRVGVEKDSKIKGLTFKCRRCGRLWKVDTE